MNVKFFALKRAYYGTMAGTRRPLKKKFGLTPARVDLLRAVVRVPQEQGGMFVCLQRALRDSLGVVASTLSEMLKALEELGLVKRTYAHDRRFRVVELTLKARLLLDRVDEWVWEDFMTEKFLASPMVEPEGRDGFFYALLEHLDFYEKLPAFMRHMVRLYTSAGPYPAWHPDD